MVWCFGHEIKDVSKLVHASNIQSLHLMRFFYKVFTMEDFEKGHVLKSIVFKIQYMKKK